MKLILVTTKNNRNSIAALCGAIEKEGLDLSVQLMKEAELLARAKNLKANSKVIIAFSFQTPDIFWLQELIPKLKKPGDFILIAGGAHPSGTPESTLKMGFNHVFAGESEETLISFLKEVNQGKEKLPAIIKGGMVDITRFPSISEKYQAFGPIEITRGCPFGCYYCQSTYLFGKMRHRNIDQITVMAKIMVRNHRSSIRFISPNLLAYGSKDGLKTNLGQLEKMLVSVRSVKGVKKIFAGSFPSEVRPEQVSQKALKIIKKNCDNDNLIIGAQSGSDRMLKRCHRGHRTADVKRAIELTLEAGFKANVDFVFGMPGETKADETKTIQLIQWLTKSDGVRIHGHSFLPLPGTPWVKEKPGKISPALREFLKDLRIRGKEYGDWEKQEEIGKMLASGF